MASGNRQLYKQLLHFIGTVEQGSAVKTPQSLGTITCGLTTRSVYSRPIKRLTYRYTPFIGSSGRIELIVEIHFRALENISRTPLLQFGYIFGTYSGYIRSLSRY